MHRLDRGAVPAPGCLKAFQYGNHNWDGLQPHQRQEIRTHLEQMQGPLCAYCEGSLEELGKHIEHFRDRHRHPNHTFDWKNLFLSCVRPDSCGHYKDSTAGPYNADDLIDPTVDDPDRFFRFHSNGTIAIRKDLTNPERFRAEETIRVFNLDAHFGRLRHMRKLAARAYLSQEPDILGALMDFSEVDRRVFVQDEVARTATDPFWTVIRHLFEEVA
jgi:uncharacterized protein (TIGR02646 family)